MSESGQENIGKAIKTTHTASVAGEGNSVKNYLKQEDGRVTAYTTMTKTNDKGRFVINFGQIFTPGEDELKELMWREVVPEPETS